MKIPISWLKEYLPTKLSPEEIAEHLTLIGLEVEGMEPVGIGFKGVVVAQVIETKPHPQADRLVIAQVFDGKETFQVVCGASNCRPGLMTAFAKEGAQLTDPKGNPFFIKKTELRGSLSEGMLLSKDELGLEKEKSSGIIELAEDSVLGEDLALILGDLIFEISLTPNLSHCASVRGVARELSAVTQENLRSPQFMVSEATKAISDRIQVSVENFQSCPRYMCRVIENIHVGPSPDWLKERVEACGFRSVNNIVDITNFVLLELGQPLHAFDLDSLCENRIVVRNAQKNEKITTLDGKEHFPSAETLLICDGKNPVAIAGIMGSLDSEVGEKTTSVLLEAAYFNPTEVRRASKRLDIHSEASYRFERGTDPYGLEEALERATSLICSITGGNPLKGKIDVKSEAFLPPPLVISCRLSRINHILGVQLAMGEVENLFRRLGFVIPEIKGDVIYAKIPSYRHDIREEIDLIEEVARLYGFDHIHKKEKPYFRMGALEDSPQYLFEKEIRSLLISEGLQEFLTCNLISPSEAALVADDAAPSRSLIKILNPSSQDQSILRESLLPGLLKVVKFNRDHEISSLAGFEVGRIHFKSKDRYFEPSVMAIVLSGKKQHLHWETKIENVDFFDLKGHLENLFEALKVQVLFTKSAYKNFHPGRQASVKVEGMEIGILGELHPATLKKLDLEEPVFYTEINLEDLRHFAKKDFKMKELPQYPASTRDLTLTLWQTRPIQLIYDAIDSVDSHLLESCSVTGVYTSEKLGPDKKNVTLRFVYRDLKKTISIQEVEKEHQRITEVIAEKIKEEVS